MPCDAHLSALEVVLSRSGNDANAVSIYYYEQNRRLGGGHPKTQTRRSKRKLLVQSIPPLPIDTFPKSIKISLKAEIIFLKILKHLKIIRYEFYNF